MDWLSQVFDQELFRISRTPVTPVTLLFLGGAMLLATVYGQRARDFVAGLLSRLPGVGARDRNPAAPAPNAFGTFGGVFTPSILTILGVVMYLRLGWVVGNAGLGGALLIVGASHLITVATGLSISSVATNKTVGAGGAYYIISRSLGAPTGAAIGIPLFFGQALSVTFYIIGFTESLGMLIPGLPQTHISTLICITLTLVSLKSARLAIRTQYFVMAAIGISLLSFFGGRVAEPPAEILWWNPDGRPLTEVFAVFFPAVTGIMAGVGMSGDLKDPRTSLPRGTMLAIGVGSFEANTVMMGWQRKPEQRGPYLDMLRDLVQFDRSLLIVNYDGERKFGARRSIHIWWGGLQGNGGLMLLLAFLIKAHHQWRDADVCLMTVVSSEEEKKVAEAGIQRVLDNARVEARPRVILRGGRAIHQIMHDESGAADLAIIGLGLPRPEESPDPFFERMDRMLDGMPTTVLVHSARNFKGAPVLFDQE